MSNLNNSGNSTMKTTVKNYFLTEKGLLISFLHNGKWGNFKCDPAQTCTLLEDGGYIYHFSLGNNLPTIYTQTSWADPGTDGEPVEDSRLQDETWKEFVTRFSLVMDDAIALQLTLRYIQLQELAQWEADMKEKMSEIPTLVRNIAS